MRMGALMGASAACCCLSVREGFNVDATSRAVMQGTPYSDASQQTSRLFVRIAHCSGWHCVYATHSQDNVCEAPDGWMKHEARNDVCFT